MLRPRAEEQSSPETKNWMSHNKRAYRHQRRIVGKPEVGSLEVRLRLSCGIQRLSPGAVKFRSHPASYIFSEGWFFVIQSSTSP